MFVVSAIEVHHSSFDMVNYKYQGQGGEGIRMENIGTTLAL